MKILTLTQPWASLVAWGEKCFETRSWKTSYRGLLGIHAAKEFPRDAYDFALTNRFVRAALARQDARGRVPRGEIIAVVRLVGIEPTDLFVLGPGIPPGQYQHWERDYRISEQEFSLGDYSAGRFAWHLEDVYKLPEPIPATGRQRLWEYNGFTAEQLCDIEKHMRQAA